MKRAIIIWFVGCFVMLLLWIAGERIQPKVIHIPILRTETVEVVKEKIVYRDKYIPQAVRAQNVDGWQIRELAEGEYSYYANIFIRGNGRISDHTLWVLTYQGEMTGHNVWQDTQRNWILLIGDSRKPQIVREPCSGDTVRVIGATRKSSVAEPCISDAVIWNRFTADSY